MNYTIDISNNALASIAILAVALVYVIRITKRGRTTADADIVAWDAWYEVSKQALEQGKEVPPPPGSQAKR